MRAVLMLHAVDRSGSVLSVAPEELGSLVEAVRRSGHEIVPLLDLLAEPDADDRIALSFDDGLASVAEAAADVLESHAAPATLFLTSGRVGADNAWPSQPESAPRLPMLSWEQVGELGERGWSIEAHSVSHPDLRTLDDAELERELVEPLDEIERRCGRRPSILAYPYGYFDARVVDRARRLYRFAVTTSFRSLPRRNLDPMRAPRLDAFYLRQPGVHRRFGGPGFGSYLALRRALRRLRGHPGEIS